MVTRSIDRAIANELWTELCVTKGACWLPVLTDSMAPLIRPGDRVKVSRVAPGEVRFGDIVVFKRNNDLIVHRVFKRRHTPEGVYFSEKGDAGCVYGLVNGENIIGRVTGLKKGTRTFDFEPSPGRMANLIISAWCKITAAGINRLKPSPSLTVTMSEKIIHKMLSIGSRFLVAVCLAIWYPAGLLLRIGELRTTARKNKLAVLFTKAGHILRTEGPAALSRRGAAFLFWQLKHLARRAFDYRVVYLYEHTLKERPETDFLPMMQDYTFHIITTNQQADELAANGFQDLRKHWRTARQGLEAGAIAFCVFVGRELAHVGWVAMNNKAKDTFDSLPYRVGFSSNEACTGGTWTWPKYRGKGLMKYIYFKRFQYLWERGIKTSRNAVGVDNAASQKVHAKFGPRIYARARYLRVGKWYLKKESLVA
jgi:signal peptidase I